MPKTDRTATILSLWDNGWQSKEFDTKGTIAAIARLLHVKREVVRQALLAAGRIEDE